jgi:hypothetical protein
MRFVDINMTARVENPSAMSCRDVMSVGSTLSEAVHTAACSARIPPIRTERALASCGRRGKGVDICRALRSILR